MFAEYGNTEIGVIGDLPEPMQIDKFIKLINNELDEIICAYAHLAKRDKSQTTTLINNKIIHRVGVVSGGGADTAGECIDEEADCLLTGEFGHTSYHYAKENNLSIIAPGHYRTEVPGVVAVMDIIKQNFDIETEFIHIPTEL
jgi:putative NIF3 family GTP cyclohydrolase 1 type 2